MKFINTLKAAAKAVIAKLRTIICVPAKLIAAGFSSVGTVIFAVRKPVIVAFVNSCFRGSNCHNGSSVKPTAIFSVDLKRRMTMFPRIIVVTFALLVLPSTGIVQSVNVAQAQNDSGLGINNIWQQERWERFNLPNDALDALRTDYRNFYIPNSPGNFRRLFVDPNLNWNGVDFSHILSAETIDGVQIENNTPQHLDLVNADTISHVIEEQGNIQSTISVVFERISQLKTTSEKTNKDWEKGDAALDKAWDKRTGRLDTRIRELENKLWNSLFTVVLAVISAILTVHLSPLFKRQDKTDSNTPPSSGANVIAAFAAAALLAATIGFATVPTAFAAHLPDCKTDSRCLLFEKEQNAKDWDEQERKVLALTAADVETMIHDGADVHAKYDNGSNSLQDAVAYGNAEIIPPLLAAGADVHAKDQYGYTPLHLAALNGRIELISVLLAAGADAAATDNKGMTPAELAKNRGYIDFAAALENLVYTVVDEDSAENADVVVADYPSHLPDCAANSRCLLLEDLIAAKKWDEFNAKWQSFTAADMQTMIHDGADVHATDHEGWTPFHWAAYNGHAEAVSVLFNAGADVHAKDNNGNTPLALANQKGHSEIVAMLEDSPAAVVAEDSAENADVVVADYPSHLPDCSANPRCLLFDKEQNAEDWDEQKRKVLALTAADVQAMIDGGADINAKYDYGGGALSEAIHYGNFEVIPILVKAGADVHAKRNKGMTPLHGAARYNENPEVITMLIDAGADVHTEFPYIDGATGKERTPGKPLHQALFNPNYKEIITALVASGADINAKSKSGKTALDWAQGFAKDKVQPGVATWLSNHPKLDSPEVRELERQIATNESKLAAQQAEFKEKCGVGKQVVTAGAASWAKERAGALLGGGLGSLVGDTAEDVVVEAFNCEEAKELIKYTDAITAEYRKHREERKAEKHEEELRRQEAEAERIAEEERQRVAAVAAESSGGSSSGGKKRPTPRVVTGANSGGGGSSTPEPKIRPRSGGSHKRNIQIVGRGTTKELLVINNNRAGLGYSGPKSFTVFAGQWFEPINERYQRMVVIRTVTIPAGQRRIIPVACMQKGKAPPAGGALFYSRAYSIDGTYKISGCQKRCLSKSSGIQQCVWACEKS